MTKPVCPPVGQPATSRMSTNAIIVEVTARVAMTTWHADCGADRGDRAARSRSSTDAESPSVPSEETSNHEEPTPWKAPAVQRVSTLLHSSSPFNSPWRTTRDTIVRKRDFYELFNVENYYYYYYNLTNIDRLRGWVCIVSHVEDDRFTNRQYGLSILHFLFNQEFEVKTSQCLLLVRQAFYGSWTSRSVFCHWFNHNKSGDGENTHTIRDRNYEFLFEQYIYSFEILPLLKSRL